jgi:protein SCO1
MHAGPKSPIWIACMVLLLAGLLIGCEPRFVKFNSLDIAGTHFGNGFKIRDYNGMPRTPDDFKGKVVILFFGYTQCPEICPTTLSSMASVFSKLGERAKEVQVIFITLDPQRDGADTLREYVQGFDPSFLALRPEPEELQSLVDDYKVYYQKVEGRTPNSYTMDHTAGELIFDKSGAPRLFSKYGANPDDLAQDIRILLDSS